jgi:hypothetical protein
MPLNGSVILHLILYQRSETAEVRSGRVLLTIHDEVDGLGSHD